MLKLALGSDWKVIAPREFQHEALGLRLDVDPTRLVAPQARAEVMGLSSLVTSDGWRIDCSETRVTLPGGELEHQLRARYHIYDARPLVIIAGSPDHIAQHRAELDAILCSATLEVQSAPVCLADLLADVDG